MLETMFVYGSIYFSKAKERAKEKFMEWKDEERGGAEVLATIILVAIVVLLAVAFKKQLTELAQDIWKSVGDKSKDLSSEINISSK